MAPACSSCSVCRNLLMVTLGVGIAGSGHKTGQRMPRSGHSEHPAGVRHQFGMLSAFSVERCPPSWWNTVRHQRGIVSAIAWNTHVWATRFFEILDPGAFDEHFFNGLLGIGTRPCKFNELQGFLLEDCPHATAKESRCSRFAYSRANRVVGRECASRRLANTTQFFALQNMK